MNGVNSKFVLHGLVIKNINVIDRPNKSPLFFVDLVDPDTYEATGELMYMPTDRTEQLPPLMSVVDVQLKPGQYNGRPSFNFASIKPSKQPVKTA